MSRTFDFDEQLSVGNRGESDFIKFYSSMKPIKSQDRSIDFVLANGKTVELKTDTYDIERTPNFFMEIFGDITESKIGGPWRALQDGVTFFVYYFPKNRTFFWFDTVVLCRRLDDIVSRNSLLPKEIKNKGWSARGYAVPRAELIDIEYQRDTF